MMSKTNDRYEILANSAAVNKTAAIVTSQAGCDDNIFIDTDEEKLKALCTKKSHYAEEMRSLKKEMKIKPSARGRKLPRFILDHPKYPYYTHLRDKLHELDIGIKHLSEKVKNKISPHKFANDFVTIVKEKYPHIYDEVKESIKKQQQD